ncbi:MAG: hypothetical protein ACKPJD_26095, partial [Planctomycetaceae bacterium]
SLLPLAGSSAATMADACVTKQNSMLSRKTAERRAAGNGRRDADFELCNTGEVAGVLAVSSACIVWAPK